ncbi:uncharacterized protein LOC118417637 [Branchiostoma floridae]|uniref:Uncharacterized protein LOC118417637 n=1 Tax=Branchiostoma floridae TaxID=7739 RepID=C3YLB5_BRAFL|nr:uncharacterized protein LOC118417637 [Branchiostoma floridae]|eukprot:XP_002602840.1 hypothetical protein BRAFLDRAFT_99167 [Branchiostoma floridae]
MAQSTSSTCPSEKALRKERLARSTHVSQLVSSFEALTSQPCMTPVQSLPDADEVLSRSSIQELKDKLLGKTRSTPSETIVVSVRPQKPTRTKSLNDAATESESTKKPQKPPRTNSLADRDGRIAVEVRQEELLRTLVLGDTTAHATVTVKSGRTPALPDAAVLVPAKLVEPAPSQPLADAAASPTESTPVLQPPPKPARCKDFVLYRNNVGHFGFSLLTTLTPDLEPVHVVFQAADSIATLPVGRLVSVNYLPVQGKTASELYEMFNRSPESVRLRIQQLYFPLSVVQGMVEDQTSPVTYKEHVEYRRQQRLHPAKEWMKRKVRGLVSAVSRCRVAIKSCWR